MPPAARIGDIHMCTIHGPGPLFAEGSEDVLIGHMRAAREGDRAKCCWVLEDPVVRGEPSVLINGKPAARLGDPTNGGTITQGLLTVLIGAPLQARCMEDAAESGSPFVENVDVSAA